MDSFNKFCNNLALDPALIGQRLVDNPRLAHLLHGAIGLQTEAGEILDAVKKALIYGKPLDEVNVKEELGDVYHYAEYCNTAIGSTREQCEAANVAKLQKRYPNGFNEKDAVNRNLDAERVALEVGGATDAVIDFSLMNEPELLRALRRGGNNG